MKKDGTDLFLGKYLNGNNSNKLVWPLMLSLFTLRYGQSQVERGFNNNANIIVENLHNNSLIAQRVVYDHMFFNLAK